MLNLRGAKTCLETLEMKPNYSSFFCVKKHVKKIFTIFLIFDKIKYRIGEYI